MNGMQMHVCMYTYIIVKWPSILDSNANGKLRQDIYCIIRALFKLVVICTAKEQRCLSIYIYDLN